MPKPSKKLIRERLEEVKRRITAKPRSYNQEELCGSVCCIAGHLDIIVNGMAKHQILGRHVMRIASDAIGDPEAWVFGAVFYGLKPFCSDLSKSKTPKARAAVACRAIDAYMKERKL